MTKTPLITFAELELNAASGELRRGAESVRLEPQLARVLALLVVPGTWSPLGVGHVVLGQIQEIDTQLRIATRLIRVKDQVHLWAHRFEPSMSDAASLNRQVSETVARAVGSRLLQP